MAVVFIFCISFMSCIDHISEDFILDALDSRPTLRLASWNIRYFSNGSRDDIELKHIANILINYDFIAVIEIRDEIVLERVKVLLDQMGRVYDHLISDPVGNKQKERYAFLFDREMVYAKDEGFIIDDIGDKFLREPYFASFQSGQFDFTVIASHVVWGKTVKARKEEVKQLAGVYNFVQDLSPFEQDVILLGDFNRNSGDNSYDPLFAIPEMVNVFNLPDKSHIMDTSLYDNIFFQSNYLIEYTGESGIEYFDEVVFNNDDKAASLAVSDHRPIWIELFTDFDDD